MRRFKVYVGYGFTHAPDYFQKKVEIFKSRLREIPGVEVLCFLDIIGGSPRDIYDHDIINCVYRCDLMVSVCDFPSTGLGYEMSTQAEKRGKPLLVLAHRESKVTKLIIDPGKENYEFYRYTEILNDGFSFVKKRIQEMMAETVPEQVLVPG